MSKLEKINIRLLRGVVMQLLTIVAIFLLLFLCGMLAEMFGGFLGGLLLQGLS